MTQPPPSKLAALLFAVTIGVGAFLLFQVQFILGKQILPWFGGVPAVWTTCMLFFQVFLLLGYGYAHLLGSSHRPSRQRAIHLVALVLAVGLLVARVALWPTPITPSGDWKPGSGDNPILGILGLLVFTIGLPYLVLSATGPLLQNWFGRCFPGRSPYRLYALSNLGSLLGLLSYPFLLEPELAIVGQGWVWSIGFLVFALGCAGCAVLVGRTAPLPAVDDPSSRVAPPPTAGRRALWFGLAMVASVLLLATTSQISLEVAVIPFLWMLPLSLYLISFILCFEVERAYHRGVWMPLLLVGAGGCAALIRIGIGVPMLLQLAVYNMTLLAACMVCHGEVVRHKPDPRHLTGFYLFVAAGGAAGGLFAGILAPLLFPDLWELPLALVAACALAVVITARIPPPGLRPGGRRLRSILLGAYVLAMSGVLGWHIEAELAGHIHVARGFFGVLRVDQTRGPSGTGKLRRRLKHGRIIHGFQFVDRDLGRQPTSYYGPDSAIGLAIRNHPRRLAGRPLKLGFVGLGAGTLASYAVRGDSVRFYEINPDVVALSAGPDPIFTYLRDSAGSVAIALGDARINMEREPSEKFQVLALDAFSSDSIPVHLLTLEAARLYMRHLSPDGILAIHISNRHINLDPVVRALASALHLTVIRIDDDSSTDVVWQNDWMLLARDPSALAAPAIQDAITEPTAPTWQLLWTDAFSNLLHVFKG
ncbi:MAG TPA: hypothetical protein VKB80_17725 [Kofleriaceae bacterium]|nr:hypothetical protein [Kofleriaceae bacterium]